MKKLLWVGDAGCPSGFARASHEILDRLRYMYNVTVLGINYLGDPHDYPYPIYAAIAGGDGFGVYRLLQMCYLTKPDVIVIQQDGWNIQSYVQQLADTEFRNVPIVAAVAVDGKNFQGAWLNGITHAIFWTQFALDEARAGGYDGPANVIPLGVDIDAYEPEDKQEARKRRKLDQILGAFIVGNVNRNQPRKRWDLTIRYFAEWIKSKKVDDAWLYLHAAPTGDSCTNVAHLAKYYGVWNRLALNEPISFQGVNEEEMKDTYNCFDVQISTTQGEGFGLTTFEGMACGVPQIVPDWSALGDLTRGAAQLVPCTSTAIGLPYVNVIGGVPDEARFVEALDVLYTDKILRARLSSLGLSRVHEDRFRWQNIGDTWVDAIAPVVNRLSLV